MTARSARRAARLAWVSLIVAVVAALLGIWQESEQWWLTAVVFLALAALSTLGTMP